MMRPPEEGTPRCILPLLAAMCLRWGPSWLAAQTGTPPTRTAPRQRARRPQLALGFCSSHVTWFASLRTPVRQVMEATPDAVAPAGRGAASGACAARAALPPSPSLRRSTRVRERASRAPAHDDSDDDDGVATPVPKKRRRRRENDAVQGDVARARESRRAGDRAGGGEQGARGRGRLAEPVAMAAAVDMMSWVFPGRASKPAREPPKRHHRRTHRLELDLDETNIAAPTWPD